jgi:transcriptional regulator of arginine metabolism
MANKRDRQTAILETIAAQPVTSQEELRKLLLRRGWDVTQATLSRDLRELRVARVPTTDGAQYAVTDPGDEIRPALDTLLPQLARSPRDSGGR